MLRPQDSSTRERKNLDGIWSFKLDADADADAAGRDRRWYAASLTEARDLAVPASFNAGVGARRGGRDLADHSCG